MAGGGRQQPGISSTKQDGGGGEGATATPAAGRRRGRHLPASAAQVAGRVSPSWNTLLSSAAFADRYHAARTRTVPMLVTLSTTKPAEERAFCCGKACHGAVLVGRPHLGAFRFRLRNPSTGGALPLPSRRHQPWRVLSAGLGYDARARAHKAVLVEELDGLVRPGEKRMQCLVFAVGAAQWRSASSAVKTRPCR
jgi:hypothetical protein